MSIVQTLSLLLALPHAYNSGLAEPHAWHSHAGDVITSSDAFVELKQGNQRFIAGTPEYPRQDIARRAMLAYGQKPNAIILSCSDSRLPPELIFDQGLGELFVVRSAGAVADSVEIASIEYAIAVLECRLVVVLGHSHCGAIGAALSTPVGKSAGSQHLDHLLDIIRPNIAHVAIDKSDKTYVLPVKANVDGVARTLEAQSSIINDGVKAKQIQVVRGIYHLATGKVGFWP